MNKDYIMNTFKSNFTNKIWTREKIEYFANNYHARGILSDDDLADLQEFFEPTELLANQSTLR